jgi:hypothetical protein
VDNDFKKAEAIMKVKKDIERYSFFDRAVKLGITFTKSDLSFSDMVLFSFIKDAINE